MSDIVVKSSKIHGRGLFASRDFKKGEAVVVWHPKPVESIESVPEEERQFILEKDGKAYLMQEPERFMNHSCEPNTAVNGAQDVAIRDIKAGEEITTDYSLIKGADNFVCQCESRSCKRKIDNR